MPIGFCTREQHSAHSPIPGALGGPYRPAVMETGQLQPSAETGHSNSLVPPATQGGWSGFYTCTTVGMKADELTTTILQLVHTMPGQEVNALSIIGNVPTLVCLSQQVQLSSQWTTH